jgi:outer membrane biosynthesis protein TonB
MKRGLTISCIGHVIALLCAVLAISAQPMQAPPVQALPVDFISAQDFSQMTHGAKNAPKLKIEDPKPLADKVDAPKAVDQLAPKAADKPAITTDSAAAAQEAKPELKPVTQPQQQAKAEPKPADKPEKPKAPELRLDQIADILKRDEAKKPPKPQQDPKPSPDKAARDSPKFDANQVAALLDKRDPRRKLAAAEQVNDAANLGTSTGQAAQLSQSEIDALRARLTQCWNPPAGVDVNSRIYVVLRVLFKTDGSMVQEPAVVEASASTLGPALADSAKRALLLCQPFTMLKPEHYDQWKDLELKFDPHELLGG